MKALITFLIFAFLSLVGCVDVPPPAPLDAPIGGRSFDELAARFSGGTTIVDRIYLATSAEGSMQEPVRRLYPPDQASSKRTRIRETAWRFRETAGQYPYCILTVFFHKEHGRWVAIGSTVPERVVLTG